MSAPKGADITDAETRSAIVLLFKQFVLATPKTRSLTITIGDIKITSPPVQHTHWQAARGQPDPRRFSSGQQQGPLLPRPPSLGEMPQTSRTREVQIDPTRPPGDVEPPRGPARPAPEPRPGPHPHTPPCDLDDACRKTRKVTLTCGSGSSPQSP